MGAGGSSLPGPLEGGEWVRLGRGGPDVAGRAPAGRSAVVVGFDRSAAGLAALGTAADLGGRLGADLHVVHAVDLADYPVDPDADDWGRQATLSLEAERRTVSDALADYPGRWSYVALRDDPAAALARTAEHCDALMIVVGVRSTGWRHLLQRMSGPAVSGRLLDRCRRPVLLVSSERT
ncbi:universal stress protein [Acidiferrimicrobium sp. IK]|uniref:universal stress protein n=1 Tax=Acidiferrimicrobium sp. IK TaxID=2871700 RepID=UPI0021CB900A|nr:universal stress protein [Acidiferrimicrobium sp. IK]MCU4186248.1 universal stress protein [Acidiferrimicrobium sp. IK]